jgi:opacity protein-like surface antigen
LMSLPLTSFATTLHPVVTLSTGFARANVYSSKLINFDPFQNAYIGTNHFDTETDSGLFVGAEMDFLQNWAWQLGLSYFQNEGFQESGNVYQFADPAFNNLTYQYQISSRRISIETKISRAFREIWHPYFSLSFGRACNKSYQYTETPVTSADVPMLVPFANNTAHTWAYSLGVGLDVNIAANWRLGAGYRFVNLGSASLGTTPLQSGTETISNDPIHTNELLAQISYVG